MNSGITPVNCNSKNVSFGKVLYDGEKAVSLAKEFSVFQEGALNKIDAFEKGIFSENETPKAIIGIATGFFTSILAFFGKRKPLSVTVVDNSKGPVDNRSFDIKLSENEPFKKVEEYGQLLMKVNEHYNNVTLATDEDFTPGQTDDIDIEEAE